jgi:hypothetical protein
VTAEGVHLDRKGLKLLRELAELDVQIKFAEGLGKCGERRWAMLVARRVLRRREAKSHCQQAGLDWGRFKKALQRAERG